MRTRTYPAAAAPAAALAAALVLASCGSGDDDAGDGLQVDASFYPLEFVVERVGGDLVDVGGITPPGADPHSLELSPAQVAEIDAADLVVYIPTLQAAVDEALAVTEPAAVFDAAEASGVKEESLAHDPHLWLDPELMEGIAGGIADRLAELDPDNADVFAANADSLVADLQELDTAYADGLADCAGATLVVSHDAFGYLADRYDLDQVGISGINPDAEPSPARLREVGAIVEENDVHTIFFEVITSPDVTQALAEDIGVETAVLDPIEGQTDADADYLDVMYANLEALRAGLTCGG
jgi:zinc transport system substrate-binding protein